MIENPMVIDRLWAWQERPDMPDHWEDDRTDEQVEEFAEHEDIIVDAVARWLMADDIDESKAYTVFENLPARYTRELLEEYIEAENLDGAFNEWFEERYHLNDLPDDWED